MSEFVLEIIESLNSTVALKAEEDKTKHFPLKISFNWGIGEFSVDSGYGEEIAEDLEKGLSKGEFVCQLINELKAFSLLNLHVGIELKDNETNETVFHTKSCTSFREKVVDLSGCNILNIFTVLETRYNAEMYFFVPPNPITSYFITGNHTNTAALNSLTMQLESRGNFDGVVAFICRTGEESHNNIKKCIEYAIDRIYADNRIIRSILVPEVQVRPSHSSNNFVDLTDEMDSDNEECHERMLYERDEEVICDAITSDTEDSGYSEFNEQWFYVFEHWMEKVYSDSCEEIFCTSTDYKQEIEKSKACDKEAKDKGSLVPRKIDDKYTNFTPEDYAGVAKPKTESREEPKKEAKLEPLDNPVRPQILGNRPSNQPQMHQKKLSFSSSAGHPVPIIEAPHRRPSTERRNGPKLNKGVEARVNFSISFSSPSRNDKRLPKSNLLTKEETKSYIDSKSRKLSAINSEEATIKQGFQNDFKIPKRLKSTDTAHSSSSVLEGYHKSPEGRQARQNKSSISSYQNKPSQSHNQSSVIYSKSALPQPAVMRMFDKCMLKIEPHESPKASAEQANQSTPASVKNFFPKKFLDGSTFEEQTAKRTPEEPIELADDDDDDDVTILDDDEVDENKNILRNTLAAPMDTREKKFFRLGLNSRSGIPKFNNSTPKKGSADPGIYGRERRGKN